MAKAPARPKAPPEETEDIVIPSLAPAHTTPEPSAMERMRDFTRRIVGVPKSEIRDAPPKGRARRGRAT